MGKVKSKLMGILTFMQLALGLQTVKGIQNNPAFYGEYGCFYTPWCIQYFTDNTLPAQRAYNLGAATQPDTTARWKETQSKVQ